MAELDKTVTIIGRFQVLILTGTLAMVTDDFLVFPQSFKANSGTVPQIRGQYFKFRYST
jgi:hypothetical protein